MGMHRVLQDAPLETRELHKMTDIFQYDAFTMSITLVCPCLQHVSICVVLHAVLPNQKVQATKTGYRLFHELLNVWHYIELYAEATNTKHPWWYSPQKVQYHSPSASLYCWSIQNLKSFSAGHSSTKSWLTIFAQLMHRLKWVLQSTLQVGGRGFFPGS